MYALFVILIKFLFFHLSKSECSNNVIQMDGMVYVLSEEQTDANTAQKMCRSSGGRLAQVQTQQTKDLLLQNLIAKYTADLQIVQVFKNPLNDNLTKYYFNAGIDPSNTNLALWNTPPKGELSSFKLYKRATENFFQRIMFCWFVGRDSIRPACDSGWNFNFALFGGSELSQGAIKLYHYFHTDEEQFTSRLSLHNNVLYPGFLPDFPIPILYIPDTSVFIGARSPENETNWFWSDGSSTIDKNFPQSRRDICQQMSWPLTYDNGVNLRPQSCDQDAAYFVCQFQFAANVEVFPCRGLRIFWNPMLIKEILSTHSGLYVEVEEMQKLVRSKAPLLEGEVFIEDSTATGNNFSVKVTLKSTNCTSLSITKTLEGDIRAIVPEPVNSAYIVKSTENCIIEWSQNFEFAFNISYKIIASSSEARTITEVLNPESQAGNLSIRQSLIDLSEHGSNNVVQFQIQTKSCAGESAAMPVMGVCISPSNNDVAIGAGIGASLAVVLLLLCGFFLFQRKRKLSEKQRKHQMNETQSTRNQSFAGGPTAEVPSAHGTSNISSPAYEEISARGPEGLYDTTMYDEMRT